MNAIRVMLLLAAVIVIGGLIYMLVDCAISLDNSRSQNQTLARKCAHLARLADDGLRGRSINSVIKSAGVNIVAAVEGGELRLDDVVLRVEGGIVTGINLDETCQ